MDDIKKCSKCEMNSSNFCFYEDRTTKGGLRSSCKFCINQKHFSKREKRNLH